MPVPATAPAVTPATEQAAADILAAFFHGQPTAAARIIATHVDNGHGECAGCTSGLNPPHQTWPCFSYTAATRAAVERPQR